MARARNKKKVVYITRPTPRIQAALLQVGAAASTWTKFVEEHAESMRALDAPTCWEETTARAKDLRDGIFVSQHGYTVFARFQASHEAWKRGAKWATEERLTTDAKAFVDFVARECRLHAPVIPLPQKGGK